VQLGRPYLHCLLGSKWCSNFFLLTIPCIADGYDGILWLLLQIFHVTFQGIFGHLNVWDGFVSRGERMVEGNSE
jgi:hypothetical protein